MELVILSGKGGTGKTTIAAALGELSKDVVRIDCDVDAPNFYMFYEGRDIKKEPFAGGKKALIDNHICKKCGRCESVCKFSAIEDYKIDPFICEGCGACTLVCKYDAIQLKDEHVADLFLTELNEGIISRAQMEIGGDGSGKLIKQLRQNGNSANGYGKLTIVDGSPGIGCSVISSITGSDAVLVVTEPTKSGLKDLMRVIKLCEHFDIYTMVCINKYDINNEIFAEIEDFTISKDLKLVGKIPYDNVVMKSINELKPITNYSESIAKSAIEDMWNNIKNTIKIY